jgi:pimeloyl-ACP methyl ester carboxylesterase
MTNAATSRPAPREPRRLADSDGLDVSMPAGQYVTLPGRGRTFVRLSTGPAGAPTVLLVHGWLATSGMNWYRVFEPLSAEFNVVAPDLRGHGRGIRSNAPFSLTDCADDLASLIEVLDVGPVIVAGYSLGGPISQLLWRRHSHLVSGLILCSTTHDFVPGRGARIFFGELLNYGAAAIRFTRFANVMPKHGIRLASPWTQTGPPASVKGWVTKEGQRHDARMILEAAGQGSAYDASGWIEEIDVPTAVVATMRDRALSIDAQLDTARLIGATVFEFDDDHIASSNPEYPAVFVAACRDVAARTPPERPQG